MRARTLIFADCLLITLIISGHQLTSAVISKKI